MIEIIIPIISSKTDNIVLVLKINIKPTVFNIISRFWPNGNVSVPLNHNFIT